jgi:hypothetical protein
MGSNRKVVVGVPKWIKQAPANYIKAFLDGCVMGDGSVHKKNNHIVLYAPSQLLADDYQELFLKVGLCSTVRVVDKIGECRLLNGKPIKTNLLSFIVSVTTRTNDHLFNKKHWSKEHYKGKVYCVTVPNGVIYVRRNGKAFWSGNSHELVRHRMAVYSQESTRWCNYKGGVTFIIPPWVDINEGEYDVYKYNNFNKQGVVKETWFKHMFDSEVDYQTLLNNGWSPQQARSVLPNSLKTEVVMTANMTEWKLIRNQRKLGTTGNPHPQMLELMVPFFDEVEARLPEIFGSDK